MYKQERYGDVYPNDILKDIYAQLEGAEFSDNLKKAFVREFRKVFLPSAILDDGTVCHYFHPYHIKNNDIHEWANKAYEIGYIKVASFGGDYSTRLIPVSRVREFIQGDNPVDLKFNAIMDSIISEELNMDDEDGNECGKGSYPADIYKGDAPIRNSSSFR